MMPNNGTNPPPAWMQANAPSVPGVRGMGRPKWMEYYRTGENERKRVVLNGQPVNLAPNSYIPPMQERADPWGEFWKRMMGGGGRREPASGISAVRG